jgi:hypothetical protein
MLSRQIRNVRWLGKIEMSGPGYGYKDLGRPTARLPLPFYHHNPVGLGICGQQGRYPQVHRHPCPQRLATPHKLS